MPVNFWLKFYPIMQLRVLHNSADFYWNNLLFLKMAQKQSRSSIFAIQPYAVSWCSTVWNNVAEIAASPNSYCWQHTYSVQSQCSTGCKGFFINRMLENCPLRAFIHAVSRLRRVLSCSRYFRSTTLPQYYRFCALLPIHTHQYSVPLRINFAELIFQFLKSKFGNWTIARNVTSHSHKNNDV